MGGFFRGRVFLANEAFPGFAEDLCAVTRGDFFRAIVHFRVEDDYDLAGPGGHTFQRAANSMSLRTGDHANGNRQAVHRNRSQPFAMMPGGANVELSKEPWPLVFT